ncbi:MAG: Ig-like domain-containing protein [Erysipelotrichaceae bacterium]|nr:Ig-like domain-containing protein [Erysipelotrichaceae bacterium]
MKKLLKVFLCLLVSLSLVNITPNIVTSVSAEDTTASTADVTVNVKYQQTMARSILSMVNSFRTGSETWCWNPDNETTTTVSGLSELQYDYSLEQVAMQRAAELAISYSHTRPDGSTCWTAYDDYNYSKNSAGENIARRQTSAQQVFNSWLEANEKYSGQGHRRNMLGIGIDENGTFTDYEFNAIGIACVYYNGTYYWAMELAKTNNVNTTATDVNDAETTVTVSVDTTTMNYSLSADTTSYEMVKGGTLAIDKPTLNAVINNVSYPITVLGESFTWSSDNERVATVDSSGTVTAQGVGNATITAKLTSATYGELTITYTITVPEIPITSIDIGNDFELNVGSSKTLEATISPSNTTDDTTITWSSSDTSVATVDSTGKVTAISNGDATITAETSKRVIDTCKVTVVTPVTKVSLSPTSVDLYLGQNTTAELTATVSPSSASNQTLTWASGDELVATVDSSGKVTAVGSGTTTITATSNNNIVGQCTVTVYDVNLNDVSLSLCDKTAALSLSSTPALPNGITVSWSIADSTIATVDSSTGEVTALKAGETTIIAKLLNGIEVSSKLTVTDHTESETWETTKEATCTEKGIKVKKCTICSSILKTAEIDELGHDYQSVVATEPTCTTTGIRTYTCTRCNDSYIETISATGHTYGEPTFTWSENYSKATATFTCTKGDDTKTVDANVTSHTTEATCTVDGKTVYTATVAFNGTEYTDTKIVTIPATGHTYGEPTFTWSEDYSTVTAAFTCTKCNDTQTVDATVTSQTIDATCTTDGSTIYTATATLNGQTYTDTKTETISATGHTYGNPTFTWTDHSSATATFTCAKDDDTQTVNATITSATTAATCTVDGKIVYTATVTFNGTEYTDTKTVTIKAIGHTYGEPTFTWSEDYSTASAAFTCATCGDTQSVDATVTSEMTKAASCTEDGKTVYTATVTFNGTEYIDTKTETIAATGHSYDNGTVTTNPTCTADGVMTYTCSSCGDKYTESITATGHSYDNGVVTTEATCTTDGVKTYTCTLCGDTYTESIAATGHSYDEGVVTTEATCTEDGVKTYTCTSCGHTYTGSIAATGHSYDNGTVTTAPTCTTDGVMTYTCTTCGDTYTETITATGHSYDGVVTKAATCTEDGVMTYTCTLCGHTYTESITATGHDYDVTWTWADDYSKATLTLNCKNCDDVQTFDATVTSDTTAATCTEAGKTIYTAVTTASDGTTYVSIKSETIPATGHSYDSGVITKAASETEEGIMTYTCSVCGETYTEAVPALGKDDDSKPSTVTSNPTGSTNRGQSGNSSSTNSETDNVQTSDNSQIGLYASMMGIALLACILVLSKKKRKAE